MAFVPDGEERAAAVHVWQDERGVVSGEASSQAAADQAERILGLDVDGSGFAAIGEQDSVVAELQARWPGFRPPSFPSPFEAGIWFLISQRTQYRHALDVKERLAAELGEDAGGLQAFPSPHAIAAMPDVPGVPAVKLERARALARAALDGCLHGERLRALGPEAAIGDLLQLPGVGPFTAEGIVVRGANEPDWMPAAEPRLRRSLEQHYGPGADVEALSAGWRPYRSWVAVLLRRALSG